MAKTRSPKRDPREVGAEWDGERWGHPLGDEYLREALSTDEAFAAAKADDARAQEQGRREAHGLGDSSVFDTGTSRHGNHTVVKRRGSYGSNDGY